jgi:hypothetical protein
VCASGRAAEEGLVCVFGAESPGLTASLAITPARQGPAATAANRPKNLLSVTFLKDRAVKLAFAYSAVAMTVSPPSTTSAHHRTVTHGLPALGTTLKGDGNHQRHTQTPATPERVPIRFAPLCRPPPPAH